eukprot:1316178-Prymnesium_polylepis.1
MEIGEVAIIEPEMSQQPLFVGALADGGHSQVLLYTDALSLRESYDPHPPRGGRVASWQAKAMAAVHSHVAKAMNHSRNADAEHKAAGMLAYMYMLLLTTPQPLASRSAMARYATNRTEKLTAGRNIDIGAHGPRLSQAMMTAASPTQEIAAVMVTARCIRRCSFEASFAKQGFPYMVMGGTHPPHGSD